MTHLAPSAAAESIEALTLTCGPHTHTTLAAGPRSGECVLLLHGWPEFADCWREILAALGAAGYRAVAVDQRGYAIALKSSRGPAIGSRKKHRTALFPSCSAIWLPHR